MAEQSIGMMTQAMTQDMGAKLGGYYQSLQTKYGDPRVYQAQQNEMARDQAAVLHARAHNAAATLKSAYGRQQERNRAVHNTRIASKKSTSKEPARTSSTPKTRTRVRKPP